jgi:hypothetical protein
VVVTVRGVSHQKLIIEKEILMNPYQTVEDRGTVEQRENRNLIVRALKRNRERSDAAAGAYEANMAARCADGAHEYVSMLGRDASTQQCRKCRRIASSEESEHAVKARLAEGNARRAEQMQAQRAKQEQRRAVFAELEDVRRALDAALAAGDFVAARANALQVVILEKVQAACAG